MDWLIASIVLSIVLTIVLNSALRAFPGAGDAVGRRFDELADRDGRRRSVDGGRPRVQVWFPWKGMLVASVGLTVVVNLLLWLR